MYESAGYVKNEPKAIIIQWLIDIEIYWLADLSNCVLYIFQRHIQLCMTLQLCFQYVGVRDNAGRKANGVETAVQGGVEVKGEKEQEVGGKWIER